MGIGEKLLDKFKKNKEKSGQEAVNMEDVIMGELTALAIFDPRRDDYGLGLSGYYCKRHSMRVVENLCITRTGKGRFVIEGTETDSLIHGEDKNGLFSRLFMGTRLIEDYWLGSSITEKCGREYCKMVCADTKVIPLYDWEVRERKG